MWLDRRGSEVLPNGECLRLLATAALAGAVGRLAVAVEEAPLIVPLNFAYDDQLVLVRIGEGLLATKVPGRLVAFEVDHVDRQAGVAWSVVAQGLATEIPREPDAPSVGRPQPRPIVPEPGDMLVAIRTDVVTGRRFRLLADEPVVDHPVAPSPEPPTGG
jgi:uncharacterized protein